MSSNILLYPAAIIAAFVYGLLILRYLTDALRAWKQRRRAGRLPVCWLAPDDALWLDGIFSDAYEEMAE